MSDPIYSVVIPVYHGEGTLELLFSRLQKFFLAEQLSFEVVFVWDAGPDQSWAVIKSLKEKFPEQVHAVKLSRNFGQHNAIVCGIKWSRGIFIVTMDEDLQHHPEDIRLLIGEQRRDSFDLVYGKFDALAHTTFRNLTSRLLKMLIALGIPELHPDYTGFRLIKRDIAQHLLNMNDSYTFLDGYLSWITSHVSSIPVTHGSRHAGTSGYSLRKLVNHAVNIFVTFSSLPIRLVSSASVLLFLVSAAYASYLLFRRIVFNDLIPGFASIAIVLGIGFGFTLLALGILGEYLHRVNLKTTRRPNFLESERL